MPVQPTSSETEQDFIGRCMSEEKESFPDETQRYAVCKSKWDNSKMSKQEAFSKNLLKFKQQSSVSELIQNGINLADYPWDECIADQTEKYGDEETAKKVCGYIKSQYGSPE